MALFDDEEKLMAAHDNQEQEAEGQDPIDREQEQYLGLIFAACTVSVVLLFWAFGAVDIGVSAAVCICANIFAVRQCWDLRGQWWFWCLIVFMLALNVPLVVRFPWPHRWISRVELLPIGLADMLLTVGVVRFVQKFILRYNPPPEGE